MVSATVMLTAATIDAGTSPRMNCRLTARPWTRVITPPVAVYVTSRLVSTAAASTAHVRGPTSCGRRYVWTMRFAAAVPAANCATLNAAFGRSLRSTRWMAAPEMVRTHSSGISASDMLNAWRRTSKRSRVASANTNSPRNARSSGTEPHGWRTPSVAGIVRATARTRRGPVISQASCCDRFTGTVGRATRPPIRCRRRLVDGQRVPDEVVIVHTRSSGDEAAPDRTFAAASAPRPSNAITVTRVTHRPSLLVRIGQLLSSCGVSGRRG